MLCASLSIGPAASASRAPVRWLCRLSLPRSLGACAVLGKTDADPGGCIVPGLGRDRAFTKEKERLCGCV